MISLLAATTYYNPGCKLHGYQSYVGLCVLVGFSWCVPILQPKIPSVLLLHSFQLMIHSFLHFLETTMHIPQLINILQVGAYSDLMKMFPSSFELLMVMLAMTRISMVTTLFFTFPPLILYSYYSIISGVSRSGVLSLRGCFGVWVSPSRDVRLYTVLVDLYTSPSPVQSYSVLRF